MKNIVKFLLMAVLGLCLCWPVFAGIAVIVHPDNTNALNEDDIRRIFLGKMRVFPDGSDVTVLNQEVGSYARSEFVGKLLRKNESQLNAYWARMLFSSKAIPPRVVSGSEDVKYMVAQNRQAIAYIDASLLDKTVKALVLIP